MKTCYLGWREFITIVLSFPHLCDQACIYITCKYNISQHYFQYHKEVEEAPTIFISFSHLLFRSPLREINFLRK